MLNIEINYQVPFWIIHVCIEIILSSSLMLCRWKLSDTLLKYCTIIEEITYTKVHNSKTCGDYSNSPRNLRIADIPLLDAISNAVGVPFSQAHHVDKFVSEHCPPP